VILNRGDGQTVAMTVARRAARTDNWNRKDAVDATCWRQIGVHWEAGAPMKKYLTWALGAFVVFYLLKSPAGAAHVVHNALGSLSSAGNSLSRFVNAL
jgi:hypothetical protein